MNCEGCNCATSFPAGSDFERELSGLCPGCFGKKRRKDPATLAEWKVLRSDLEVALATTKRELLTADQDQRAAILAKRDDLTQRIRDVNQFFSTAKYLGKSALEDAAVERILAKVADQTPPPPTVSRRDANGTMRSAESAALLLILRVLEDNTNWKSAVSVAMARKRMMDRCHLALFPGALAAGRVPARPVDAEECIR